MAANRNPIFPRTPKIRLGGAVLGPSANTALDGSGANVTEIWQADSAEGSLVKTVSLKPVGSPAATVARVFICSHTGSFTPGTSNTAANTSLFRELSLQAITQSQTAASPNFDIDLGPLFLEAGFRLLLAFGTSTGAAGTGYAVSVHGGSF